MHKTFLKVVGIGAWAMSSVATATDFFAHLGLSYQSTENTYSRSGSDGGNKYSRTDLNLSLGIKLDQDFTLGLKHYIRDYSYSDSVSSDLVDAATTSDSESGITGTGVFFGYFADGFNVMAAYILQGPISTDGGDPEEIFSGGSGIIVDIGWLFGGKAWKFGPQFSYVSLEYKKREIDGEEDEDFIDSSNTEIFPSLAISFNL